MIVELKKKETEFILECLERYEKLEDRPPSFIDIGFGIELEIDQVKKTIFSVRIKYTSRKYGLGGVFFSKMGTLEEVKLFFKNNSSIF